MSRLIATSSQTIGPFFSVGLWRPEWSDLTRNGLDGGAPIRIEGSVIDGDGVGVPDALIEIWQADAQGRYEDHDAPVPADRLFRGFGRCGTDADGRYAFRSIVPGVVSDASGTPQAPHANVTVFARGMLTRVVTRLYFGDRAEQNAGDPVLQSLPEAARATLIAPRIDAGADAVYRFDIILQGDGETAFFDL